MPSGFPPQSPHALHSMPERIQQCLPRSSLIALPPVFPPPVPKCSNGSLDRPDPRPPSDDRDWGEAHPADTFLRCSLPPLFLDPAFLSAFPPVPPALLSYLAAPGLATSSASISFHSSFQNCYPSARSISLAVLIAPSSALINGSLTPSVIGDRPSHAIYGLVSTVGDIVQLSRGRNDNDISSHSSGAGGWDLLHSATLLERANLC